MGDVGDFYNDLRHDQRLRKEDRLKTAVDTFDLTGWTKHTPYHWSRILNDQKLNWYPSTGRWSYGIKNNKPKMFFGSQNDLINFIKNRISLK